MVQINGDAFQRVSSELEAAILYKIPSFIYYLYSTVLYHFSSFFLKEYATGLASLPVGSICVLREVATVFERSSACATLEWPIVAR